MFEKDNENNHMSENENEMNEKTVNSNYSFDEMKLKNITKLNMKMIMKL